MRPEFDGARRVRRPVKVVLTREQMYTRTGFRLVTEYMFTLGAGERGRLSAAMHDIRPETSTYEDYREKLTGLGQMVVRHAQRPPGLAPAEKPIYAGQAAWEYSWRTPPSRSRRRTFRSMIRSGSVIESGAVRSGTAWSRA